MENNAIPFQSPQQPYYSPQNQSPNYWKTFAIVLLMVIIGGAITWIIRSQLQVAQVQNASQQKPPTENLLPTSITIPSQIIPNQKATQPSDSLHWKEYTTNEKMDINDDFFKIYQNLKVPKLSFKYPNTWQATNKFDARYINNNRSVINIQLEKNIRYCENAAKDHVILSQTFFYILG